MFRNRQTNGSDVFSRVINHAGFVIEFFELETNRTWAFYCSFHEIIEIREVIEVIEVDYKYTQNTTHPPSSG